MKNIDLSKEITKNIWIKNWSGNWRTSFASLYHLYTTSLKPYGNNLKTNLIVCEKEVSSNYIAKKELDIYCEDLVKKIVNDNDFGNTLAEDTGATAIELSEIFSKFKKEENLTLENLLDLKEKFYTHIAPHVAMKKVIDYLPEELKKRLTRSFTEARLKTEELDLFNTTDSILRSYTKFISKKTGYLETSTEFLTIEEIILFLKSNKLPSEEELVLRSKGLVIFYEGDAQTLLINEEYDKFLEFLVGSDSKEIKGNIAFKGKASGVVRVVFDPFNVKIFNEGDILVTGMTRPEFLPLMKKAGAFVTDAGGLLSHAAIVARELKKPCILATEVATKVLKDGDIVEVDAEKGVITILKKA
jgi:phosphohistidine swiveling domain-containing protein